MKTDSPYEQLAAQILEMETAHRAEGIALKESFRSTYESFKPLNLLKNTILEIAKPEVRTSMLAGGITFLAEFLVQKLPMEETLPTIESSATPMDKIINPIPFYIKAAMILVAVFAIVYILYIGQEIILPLVYATMIAILLNPLVNLMVRKRFPRNMAIAVAVIIAFAVSGLLISVLASQMTMFSETYPALRDKLTSSFNELIAWFSGKSGIKTGAINTWVADSKTEAIDDFSIGDKISQAGHLVVVGLLVPIYLIMILFYKPLLLEFIRKLFAKEHHIAVAEVLFKSKSLIQTYLTGLLFEMLIVAVLNIAGLLLLGIQYAIILGIIGAILNIIPYIGGIIATALPMIIAFVTKDSLIYPLLVLIVYLVIQFIDNNFVIPKIVASRVKLNALVSMIAVLVGGALWGVPGMFLSIPLTAILKVICDHIEPLKPWGFLLGNIVPTTPRFAFLKAKTPESDPAGRKRD